MRYWWYYTNYSCHININLTLVVSGFPRAWIFFDFHMIHVCLYLSTFDIAPPDNHPGREVKG
jgi:hypothetical protein